MDPNTLLILALGAEEGVPAVERMGMARAHQGRRMRLARSMDADTRAALLALGFVFEPDAEKDPVLVPVLAPEGWRLASDARGLHAELCDPAGGFRGTFSYKAAPYDRWASLTLVPRFQVRTQFSTSVTPLPPEIAALQVEQTVTWEEEVPDVGRRVWPDWKDLSVRVHVQGGSLRCVRVMSERRVVNTYEPRSNPAHALLPYQRAVVRDNATRLDVWVGPWISYQQWFKDRTGPLSDDLTGQAWLKEHAPDRSVLAYWVDKVEGVPST